MKFNVSSGELQKHLLLVSKVINSKNSLPILDYYLFKVQGDKLEITGSDLENTMVTWFGISEVEGSGSIAIEAKRLNEIIKEFPEQPLSFEINPETFNVSLTSMNGVYSIMSMDAQDYPVNPSLNEDQAVNAQITAEALLSGITKCLFAVGNDELRPVMNGILVEFSTEGVTFVASDSHKLVRYQRFDSKTEVDSSFILPQKPSGILKNTLKGHGQMVSLSFDNRNVFFTTENLNLICRRIEGIYPAYNTVIPVNNTNELIINRTEFINSLRRVSVFSNQASFLIKLSISSDQIEISGQDIDYSISGVETLPCIYQGNPIEIGFKSIFLVEILGNLPSVEVRMLLSDPSRAGLIFPVDAPESEKILMLLMPMMIS